MTKPLLSNLMGSDDGNINSVFEIKGALGAGRIVSKWEHLRGAQNKRLISNTEIIARHATISGSQLVFLVLGKMSLISDCNPPKKGNAIQCFFLRSF